MRYMADYGAEELYADMLDEVYGVVTVAGMEYNTAYVLRNVDPIAFRCGLVDYLDSEGIITDESEATDEDEEEEGI